MQDQAEGERDGESVTIAPADIHPEAVEGWYDGIDQGHDGENDFDQDGDGQELRQLP